MSIEYPEGSLSHAKVCVRRDQQAFNVVCQALTLVQLKACTYRDLLTMPSVRHRVTMPYARKLYVISQSITNSHMTGLALIFTC